MNTKSRTDESKNKGAKLSSLAIKLGRFMRQHLWFQLTSHTLKNAFC